MRNADFGMRNGKPEPATTGERFERALESIREKVGRAEEKSQKDQDVTTEVAELRARRAEIESLDIELRKEFAATERKLKDAKLPKEIVDRHYKFIKHYEDNLAELKANLDGHEKAQKAHDKVKAREYLKKAKVHLEKTKPPKKHVPLDPNKLPFRTVKGKERAPRLKKEEFERDFGPTKGKRLARSRQYTVDSIQGNNAWHDVLAAGFSLREKTKKNPILLASNFSDIASDVPFQLPRPSGERTEVRGSFDISQLALSDSILNVESGILNLAQAASAPDLPTPADLSETPEVQFTPEIRAKAQELGYNPVKIYNWVRNNIIYEPYYGSFKNAHQTMLEGAGNDFDQASLLIALLRTSNIAARYAYGTVEIPIEKVTNWVGGVADPRVAGMILTTKGIPAKFMIAGGVIKAIQLEHAWVEAWIDYFPSWGARHKPGGEDTWIPLDPSFKQYTYKQGMDMYALMGFDAERFFQEYITDPRNITAYQDYSMRMLSFLDTNYPDASVEDVFGASEIRLTKSIVEQEFPYLLGTLPYKIVVQATQFPEAPQSKDYVITIQIEGYPKKGTEGLSYTGRLNDLASKRVTVSYEPAAAIDEALVAQYGGNIYAVPPYLIDVKPILRIGGSVAASGGHIGMGIDQTIAISFAGPDGDTDRIQNIITAGVYSAIILQSQDTPVDIPSKNMAMLIENSKRVDSPDVTIDDLLGQILYSIGVSYFHTLSFEIEVFAKTLQLVNIRQPSEAMVTQEVKVDYIFDLPRVITVGGVNIDVDRNVNAVYSPSQDKDREKAFMILSGLSSSISENRILEAFFNVPSLSAVRLLKLASEQGIPVYTITSSNLKDISPQLQIGTDVKADIVNAVNAGKNVIVSRTKITYNQWVGVGYIINDPVSGAANFMISGGLSGADTPNKTPIANPNFKVTWDMKLIFEVARTQILGFASQMTGTPYVFGSTDGGIDCSSFTALCYEKAGITLLKGKTAAGQYSYSLMTTTPLWADLMFFKGSYDKNCNGYIDSEDGVTHVAIYVGNGFMISAQGSAVQLIEIDSWGERYPSYCSGTLTCDQYGKGVCTNDAGKKIKYVPNEDADPYDPFADYGKILP